MANSPGKAAKTERKSETDLPRLEASEADGRLTVQEVAETLLRALTRTDKKGRPKIDTAADSIRQSLPNDFTHNARLATRLYDLPSWTAPEPWSAKDNAAPLPEHIYGYSGNGQISNDVAHNAAMDTLSRIMLRPWRCINLQTPQRPIDSILQSVPPYGIIRDPQYWSDPELRIAATTVQSHRLWDEIRHALDKRASRPKGEIPLSTYAGAPMVHFPLPRPHEDVNTPPEYVLCCVLPSNAALRSVSLQFADIFPQTVSAATIHAMAREINAWKKGVLERASQAERKKVERVCDQAFAPILAPEHPLPHAIALRLINKACAVLDKAALRRTPVGASPARDRMLDRIRKMILSDGPPRTRRIRILNDPGTANNIGSMLRRQDHVEMLFTRLPDLASTAAWLPDLPIDLATQDRLQNRIDSYARFLRAWRKANREFRQHLSRALEDLVAGALAPLLAAIRSGLAPEDAPSGSRTAFLALLSDDPTDDDIRQAAQEAGQDLLRLLPADALGESSQRILQDLIAEAERLLRQAGSEDVA